MFSTLLLVKNTYYLPTQLSIFYFVIPYNVILKIIQFEYIKIDHSLIQIITY